MAAVGMIIVSDMASDPDWILPSSTMSLRPRIPTAMQHARNLAIQGLGCLTRLSQCRAPSSGAHLARHPMKAESSPTAGFRFDSMAFAQLQENSDA